MKKIFLGMVFFTTTALATQAQEVVVIKKSSKDSANKPLVVIDGVITPNKDMNELSPNDIQSMNVLKGASAKVIYGEKGENGVIEITTKSSTQPTNKMGKTIMGVEIDTTNLNITVDGDQVLLNGEKVDPKDPRLKKIKRINVLGGQNSSPLMGVMLDPLAPETPPAPMNKAFLGVSTETSSEGALVVEVSPESPAAKAGLAEDDIITQVNKDPIKKQSDLYAAIGKYKEGDKVTIEYLRDGKKNKKEIVLAKNKMEARTEIYEFVPDNFNQNFNKDFNKNFRKGFALPNLPNLEEIYVNTKKPKLGISIEDLEEGNGVKITAVNEASPASKAGLKIGDIITSIDKHEVKEVNDIKWQYFDAGQTLKLSIIRNKEVKTIEVKIPKKINSADL
ncbi:MAG: PDZ domain-containing protein [Sediminibacterium sp.]|jgi:serine protease Do|nr:PDZ domain-containing protein [Sediminibacterium sp.]